MILVEFYELSLFEKVRNSAKKDMIFHFDRSFLLSCIQIPEKPMLVKICLGLSRPYPLKVSGREISYKYVPDRKYFSMKFVPADDSGTTKI